MIRLLLMGSALSIGIVPAAWTQPAPQPPAAHKQVAVDPRIFDGYEGRYELRPNFILNITREGDRLYAQATGQRRFEILPESEKEYFATAPPVQISFKTGENGQATELILHQGGRENPAKRVPGEPLRPRKSIALDAKVLEYLPKHIFEPLGMTHSALERNAQMLPHLAKGYQLMGPGGAVDSATPQREHETGRGYKVPNGAIYTTVGDLARFASFLMGQGPESVLKTASLDRFQTQSAVPADIGLTSGYGIGFEVQRRGNYVAFGHGGSVAGYTAMLLINRPKGIAVIVFSNGAANPASLAQRALDILVK